MIRRLVPLFALALAWLANAAHAHACKIVGVSVFLQAETATTVALTRVVSVTPPSGAGFGRVRLEVTEAFEGATVGDRLSVPFGKGSCDPRPRKSKSPVLVFTGPDGRLVAHYLGYIVRPDDALLGAVRRWTATTEPAERVAILLDAFASGDVRLGWEAVRATNAETLRATLDDEQRARLDAASQAFQDAGTP